MLKRVFVTLMLVCAMAVSFAQRDTLANGTPVRITDKTWADRGFDFYIAGGMLFGDKFNANYYNGSKRNENNLNFVMGNQYWYEAWQQTVSEYYPHISINDQIYVNDPADFDWKKIFAGCSWFHLTGISPALGGNMVSICIEACKAAKTSGATVSCDLNYRGKLWTREQAREAMSEICKYVDVCISNEEDAKDVFGIEAENTDITGGKLNKEGYKSVAKQLMDKFGFKKVAITLRTSINANRNNWAALLYDGKDFCFSKEYEMLIVDRVGGGDSFGGGLIYALLNGKSTSDAVEFAVAASCLKHTIEGDYNMVSVDEVEKLAGGNGSGRIQR